jgi:hypothetical protein
MGMAHALDGVWLKCQRARDHLNTLQAEFDAFGRDAYTFQHVVAREGREHVYRVNRLRHSPPEWGPIIGDCVHNAASALDQLAYQLAILRTGRLPSRIARDVHFPIYPSSREFWVNLRKLEGMGPDLVAPIERLQPYHGINGPNYHWLMILKRLSNSDKHRMLHTVGYRFGGTARYRPDSLIDTIFPTGPLKLGAELARFVFDPPDPMMNVDPSFIVHIAFKDSPLADGIDTWAMLNTICIRLEAVVDEFRPLFR